MKDTPLIKRAVSEWLGTALLVATVVGSGIMAERLAGGNVALALLANTLATGAALVSLILAFGGISGAHFNPAVSVADALEKGISWREVPVYLAAQVLGGIAGAAIAHVMFGEAVFSLSRHTRSGFRQGLGEFVATFGLMAVIWGCSRLRSSAVPFAVGAYITAAYWFTSSTSFANPAVTIARSLSDTFAGIRPADVPLFIVAQFGGALAATAVFRWLIPTLPETAKEVLVPHNEATRTYLFACVHNAGRSQMAAALFNLYGDPTQCRAISAGTEPAGSVHPQVIEVMREIGIDLSTVKPQMLTQSLAETATTLITMGCGEACPYVPGLRRLDWPLPDPKGQSIDAVREIRDLVHERVKELIRTECSNCCLDVSCR